MGERERDAETGEFVEKFPPADILRIIEDLGGAAATSEIAAEMDANRNSIYKKLQQMEGDGQVTSRLAGGIRVWSVAAE